VARRALFVTSSYPRWPGDASGAFVHRLATDLGPLGWVVEVLAPMAPGLATDATLDGVAVHRFRYSWPPRTQRLAYDGGMLSNLRARRWTALTVPGLLVGERLAVSSRCDHVDVVHAHWVVPQGLALVGLRKPLVVSVHGSDINRVTGAGRLKALALQSADAITANSDTSARRVERLIGRRPTVVPMGVELDPPVDDEMVASLRAAVGRELVVGVVARLVEEKGVADLVEAVAGLDQVGLLVVGDGPERAALVEQAASLGVQAVFAGAVAPGQVASHLAACDVVAAPSRQPEGQGLALLEAMAVGRAVVASTAGGQAESVVDGESGLLVPPDDVSSLRRALERLLGDAALRDRLGHLGRLAVAERFSRRACAQAMAKVYETVA
jgi:glycosyltransferase involved in cell wall biosynthesis